jgi:hypothetical protein
MAVHEMPEVYKHVLMGRIVKKTVNGKVIEGEVSQTQTSHVRLLMLIELLVTSLTAVAQWHSRIYVFLLIWSCLVQVNGLRSIHAIEPENGPLHIKCVYDMSHASVPCVKSLPASSAIPVPHLWGIMLLPQYYATAPGAISQSFLWLSGCASDDRAPISAYQWHWSDRKLLISEQQKWAPKPRCRRVYTR